MKKATKTTKKTAKVSTVKAKAKKKLPKVVHSFVIEEERWQHGGNTAEDTPDESYLRMPKTGKMCCLGFFCESLGVPTRKLVGVPTPDGITMKKLPDLLVQLSLVQEEHYYLDKPIIRKLTNANDSSCLSGGGFTTHTGRRKVIAGIFRKMGVKVTYK